jgi:hypothetical protein
MPPVSVTMHAMKLALPPDGADEDAAADVAAEDAAEVAADVLGAGVLLAPPELLLPQAVNANAAADSPATIKMLCVRRKTLTSPEAHGSDRPANGDPLVGGYGSPVKGWA